MFTLSIPQGRSQWPRGLRLKSGIVGSNPVGGVDVRLLRVLHFVRYRSLRRADPSYRESYLFSVCVCVCVCVFVFVWARVTECDRGTSEEAMAR
jgi:hypothetical protein